MVVERYKMSREILMKRYFEASGSVEGDCEAPPGLQCLTFSGHFSLDICSEFHAGRTIGYIRFNNTVDVVLFVVCMKRSSFVKQAWLMDEVKRGEVGFGPKPPALLCKQGTYRLISTPTTSQLFMQRDVRIRHEVSQYNREENAHPSAGVPSIVRPHGTATSST